MIQSEQKIILKLNKIFKMGYTPSRKGESYDKEHSKGGFHFGVFVNCFAHACFNLKNEQLKNLTLEDAANFGHKIDYLGQPKTEIKTNLITFVQKTGLKIRRVSKNCIPEKNQWMVALYFGRSGLDKQNQDYHFLLKEENGFWSGKMGRGKETTYYSEPPSNFTSGNYFQYKLEGYYLITNPYAKAYNNEYSQEIKDEKED